MCIGGFQMNFTCEGNIMNDQLGYRTLEIIRAGTILHPPCSNRDRHP